MTSALTYSPQQDPQALPTPGTGPRPYPGFFLAFEGPDGSGKTTQIKALAQTLTQAGYSVLATREPGGTEIGEKLRSLVLEQGQGEVDPHTEALIFAASRAAHAHQKIRPALQAGSIVLCDRYIDSSAAYQGAGRGLGVQAIQDLSRWATSNLLPDLTILLDLPLELGRQRVDSRGAKDRIESAGEDFRRSLQATYLQLAQADPSRYALIDASGSPQQVADQIWQALQSRLPEAEKK